MTDAAAFTLSGVVYRYPGQPRPTLDGITVRVARGRTTAVLGPNGAGKSTLLYLLGLLWDGEPEAGRIVYHPGSDRPDLDYGAGRMTPDLRADMRLREFGFVLQSCYLLPQLTCEENVALPLRLQGRAPAEYGPAVEALIRRADATGKDSLFERRRDSGNRVSGGQRQRFAVLRAIAHDPRVVFADEPFASIDEFGGLTAVRDLLRDWKAGNFAQPGGAVTDRTLLVVCQNLQTAAELADHFLILNRQHKVVGDRVLERAEFPADHTDCAREIAKKLAEDLI